MVNGHTIDAVLLPSIEQGPIFDIYNWGRGLVSVCFLMVAGMAFHLSSLARYEQHRRNPAAIQRRFRRALVVIAGGYFLGFPWAATSPDPAQAELAWTYFFSVGILHSIGAALIMLELLVLASKSASRSWRPPVRWPCWRSRWPRWPMPRWRRRAASAAELGLARRRFAVSAAAMDGQRLCRRGHGMDRAAAGRPHAVPRDLVASGGAGRRVGSSRSPPRPRR